MQPDIYIYIYIYIYMKKHHQDETSLGINICEIQKMCAPTWQVVYRMFKCIYCIYVQYACLGQFTCMCFNGTLHRCLTHFWPALSTSVVHVFALYLTMHYVLFGSTGNFRNSAHPSEHPMGVY